VCEDILLPGLACEQLLAALPPLAGLLILSPFAKALDRTEKRKQNIEEGQNLTLKTDLSLLGSGHRQ
jgi:hypothetical protein